MTLAAVTFGNLRDRSVNASIFITDIINTPAGTVVTLPDTSTVVASGSGFISITYAENLSDTAALNDKVVESVDLINPVVRVFLEWEGGSQDYVGTATVNGFSVDKSTVEHQDHRRYTGWTDVYLEDTTGEGGTYISARHHERGVHSVAIGLAGPGPVLLSTTILNTYPTGINSAVMQTEYMSGQTVPVQLTFEDPAITAAALGVDISQVLQSVQAEVINGGAGEGQITNITLDGSFQATIQAEVRDVGEQGNFPLALPFTLRGLNTNGTSGNTKTTDEGGTTVDHTNLVFVNEQFPERGLSTVTYPAGQTALKGTETADVTTAITFHNSTVYSTPLSELASIPNPSTYELTKTVTRSSGTYNISGINYKILAVRNANDAAIEFDTQVAIADEAPVFVIGESALSLRSGGNQGTSAQEYEITLDVTQELYEAPTLALGHTPVTGGFTGAFTGSGDSWTNQLSVHDDDPKGLFSWGAITSKNRAGVTSNSTTGDGNYKVAGFVKRTLTVGSFARTTDIGTTVFNSGALACTIHATANTGTYSTTQVTTNLPNPGIVDGFTITLAGVHDPRGDTWWYNDNAVMQSNVTGFTIVLEEA